MFQFLIIPGNNIICADFEFTRSKVRVFSTLSAPPVNGGVPKANGPVPNEM